MFELDHGAKVASCSIAMVILRNLLASNDVDIEGLSLLNIGRGELEVVSARESWSCLIHFQDCRQADRFPDTSQTTPLPRLPKLPWM